MKRPTFGFVIAVTAIAALFIAPPAGEIGLDNFPDDGLLGALYAGEWSVDVTPTGHLVDGTPLNTSGAQENSTIDVGVERDGSNTSVTQDRNTSVDNSSSVQRRGVGGSSVHHSSGGSSDGSGSSGSSGRGDGGGDDGNETVGGGGNETDGGDSENPGDGNSTSPGGEDPRVDPVCYNLAVETFFASGAEVTCRDPNASSLTPEPEEVESRIADSISLPPALVREEGCGTGIPGDVCGSNTSGS